MVRDTLAAALEMQGYRVAAAADAAAALALLEAASTEAGSCEVEGNEVAPIDLLISDLSMPGMSGLDLIRAAQERKPGLPAILLTGYAGEAAALAVGGALNGRFTLLRKPVSATHLADRVAALLEGVAAPVR